MNASARTVTFGSVCSGIEAASVAWHPLGWAPAWFAEIDPFCRELLAGRWPAVDNRGDFTQIGAGSGAIDLLVGGTPCQSFSVAGKRGGLDDPRGNLTLEFFALAGRLRPRWLVWENVPGVLSDDGGRTFGTVLGLMGKLGYGFAYRVLDAQHFGVPQRRRRVFVVGYLGDWRLAAAVLFERACLSGNPPPSRTPREDLAPTLRGGSSGGSSHGKPNGSDCAPMTVQALTRRYEKGADSDATDGLVAHSLRADGFDASEDGTGRGTPLVPVAFQSKASAHQSMNPGPITPGLDVGKSDGLAICFTAKDHGADAGELSPTLRAGGHSGSHAKAGVMPAVLLPSAQPASAVRRLTPREAERLQGFPDDYTRISYRGKPAADGPRYRALGNSMAVPCMNWLGQRIQAVEG